MVKVTLMEGSFGTQLAKYVGETIDGDPLWSARFLATEKDKCILAHRDLVRAGTEILTTGSYQASVDGFVKYLGVDEEKAISLIKESVFFAKEAIRLEQEKSSEKIQVKVAGSVGPYGAYLHDGSDYTGSYAKDVTKEYLIKWHKPRMVALIEAGVDLIGLETIPALIEAEALLSILKEFPDQQAWLAFSCKDGNHISSGEKFIDVAVKCWELSSKQLIAIGVNCLHPSLIKSLFEEVRQKHPYIPLMAYPNSGETYDTKKGRWLDKDTSLSVTDYTSEWLDLGVKYIGGCCRTNDEDLKQFKEEIRKWEKKHKEMEIK